MQRCGEDVSHYFWHPSQSAAFHDWEVKGSPAAMEQSIAYWKQDKPALMFVRLDDVDHAGHGYGWGGPEYLAAVEMVDGLVGKLVSAVREPGAEAATAIPRLAKANGSSSSRLLDWQVRRECIVRQVANSGSRDIINRDFL